MQLQRFAWASLATLCVQGAVLAQEGVVRQEEQYATRAEYEKLLREYERLKQQLEAFVASAASNGEVAAQETEEAIEDLEQQIKVLKQRIGAAEPGSARFLVTGFAVAGFVDREGEDSTFTSSFNPIFLWKIDARTFFESEVEFEIEGGELEVALEFSQLTYLVNDYATVGAGLFLAPFGTWAERFHASWINELPDEPLAFGHGGIAPSSLLGLQVRGGVQLASMKLNYALYVANGPSLVTDDDEEAGTLDFQNLTDLNNNKALGGRLGFLPVPQIEVGYSALVARVDPSGSDVNAADALLQSVDLTCVREVESLRGTAKLRSQWIWSDVDDATYDPSGAFGFGPLTIDDNTRDGGYIQLGYRPSKLAGPLRNVEVVARYDALDLPSSAPENVDESRWTFGLDYWLNPSFVVKLAYQLDDKDDPAGVEEDADAVLFQLAMGF